MMKTLLHGKLLIGTLDKMNQISVVYLSFHDMNDNIIENDNGGLLQYTSIPQDLGHFLEFAYEGFDFAYAKFRFKLRSNNNFDPNTIFFHFSHPYTTKVNPTMTISRSTTASPWTISRKR